jgi:uncharacterized protein YyaL (SSP411 family)
MSISDKEVRKTNRLAQEKSPYLLQHAHNPVDWYPWGEEAFEKAKKEDKPIFLSIGYSTCHWCHVMERESFEDQEVAEILNNHFVSIKVDREERPDIDHVYMTICQTLTGRGGWPMSTFMTPDAKPFYAGTYFPKLNKMGMPGLITILQSVAELWKERKSELIERSEGIVDFIQKTNIQSEKELTEELLHEAFNQFEQEYDSEYGGFGTAPKFPTPQNLLFLLRYWYKYKEDSALDMVEKTLNSMYQGGIFDHIGFGFSRYSTDRQWLVPHFEKMLYDNALLSIAYLEAYQATKKEMYAQVAEKIFEYVLRDMASPDGAFYSAEDADSEGEEGKFYLWSPVEVQRVLGHEAGNDFCQHFDITLQGNFEGKNILNLIKTKEAKEKADIEKYRIKLFEHREKRIHPFKDTKILTSWNGLMIAALAMGGRILDNEEYSKAAQKAVDSILEKLMRGDGRLLARYHEGETAHLGYIDDYAFLIWGLIELYETTYQPKYLEKALFLNQKLIDFFWDEENDGLFLYGKDAKELITRPKEIYDSAIPSGNSIAAYNFLRLSRLTGLSELEDRFEKICTTFKDNIANSPRACISFLAAFLYAKSSSTEIIFTAQNVDQAKRMNKIVQEAYHPFTLTVGYAKETKSIKQSINFLENYQIQDESPAAYLCKNFACDTPITDINELKDKMRN